MAVTQYVPSETSGTYVEYFKSLAAEIDAFNELREQLVKASRDITSRCKKVIFLLHRVIGSESGSSRQSRDEILNQARVHLADICDIIASRIATRVGENNFPRLHSAFTWCMQEYVEAALFYVFLTSGRLASFAELGEDLAAACARANEQFTLCLLPEDYALGAADLGGELMRHAIDAAGRGDMIVPFRVRDFLVQLLGCLTALSSRGPSLRQLDDKLGTLHQSVGKVETACFQLSIRKAEFSCPPSSESPILRTEPRDDTVTMPLRKKPRLSDPCLYPTK